MNEPQIEVVDIESLLPNTANHNTGTLRGDAAIAASIDSYGLHRGIAVAASGEAFAGSHVLEKAIASGYTRAIVIDTDGTELVVTRRTDIKDARDPKAIAAAIADNRTNQLNFVYDPDQFESDLKAIEGSGYELGEDFFTDEESDRIVNSFDQDSGFDPEIPEGNKEIDESRLAETNCECPSCGFKWSR